MAANIRAELARAGTKQSALATGLGMTQGAVSHRLTGRTAIDVEDLVAIAAVLAVPLSTLLAGVEFEAAS